MIYHRRLQHIGKAKFIYFDQSSQSGKRIIVATEDAALAVVNTRTGAIGNLSCIMNVCVGV